MSLYRKYRPLDFSSLRGQDHIREILESALKKDRVSHAYLFTGPRGTGKTSTARIMARAINCLDLRASGPCNKCNICTSALQESLTDLVEIDAASHGLVDDARALVEQARFMPTQAKKKIYIIDEVHMLSKSAFNALLKIIEEPPDHVHFILATTESHKVLETIKSRCQRFDFHLADEELLLENLKEVCAAEKVKADDEALVLLAQHGRGSFRDSLSLLEQVIGAKHVTLEYVREALGVSEQSSVEDFIKGLVHGDKAHCLKIISHVHEQGADLSQFCQALLEQLRHHLLSQTGPAQLLDWIDIFFQSLDQLRDSVIPQLPLEMAVYKCLINRPATDEMIALPQEKKPRKIQKAVPEVKSESSPITSTPVSLPPKDSSADAPAFIGALKSPALRALLRHSILDFSGSDLKIFARSQFELEKMKDKSAQQDLLQSLRELKGDKASLSFEIASENEKQPLPSHQGMSNNDIFSVFP